MLSIAKSCLKDCQIGPEAAYKGVSRDGCSLDAKGHCGGMWFQQKYPRRSVEADKEIRGPVPTFQIFAKLQHVIIGVRRGIRGRLSKRQLNG